MTSGTTDITSVIFIGNPGVGKSTLHNALGATFDSGFSPVHGMSVGVPQLVVCGGRNLLLVDVPGINDHATANSLASGETAIEYNLRILRNKLNEKGTSVVFFVIEPLLKGTIRDKDLALMKLILESLDEGPQIGLIVTLIHKDSFDTVTAPDFMATALEQVGADLKFFDVKNHLFLRKHKDTFTEGEIQDVQKYILSFEPRQVRIRQKPSNGLSFSTRVERPLALESLLQGHSISAERASQRKVKNPNQSITFIGSSGVGKSTLHNALGANFPHVLDSSLAPTLKKPKKQHVKCNGRNLRLVDVPSYVRNNPYSLGSLLGDISFPVDGRFSVDDWSSDDTGFSVDNVLNDGHSYVIFFVITPRNGRIDPDDFDVIETVLSKMSESPVVGLILTQVDSTNLENVKDPRFIDNVMDQMKREEADVRQLLEKGALVLPDHTVNFSLDEVHEIRNYVLSFLWPEVYVSRTRRIFNKLNLFQ